MRTDSNRGGSRADGPRPSSEHVIQKMGDWLSDPKSVLSLGKVFEDAQKLGEDLTERARLEVDDPLRLSRRHVPAV